MPRPPSTARGFTLVEIIVALTILGCAAFALVSASASAIRSVGAAEAQASATTAARARVEMLASADCSSLQPGDAVDSATGARERWTVERSPNGALLIMDSVQYTDRGGPHVVALQRLVIC